jgi:hypothetical protein
MINQQYYSKALKYKKKYIQLRLLKGGVFNKKFNINFNKMSSNDYSIGQNIKTTKDNDHSHYESTQSIYMYSSIKDESINDVRKKSITNIENNMKNENTDISIEENNFNKDELIEYLKLAIKYNYKVNIKFSNIDDDCSKIEIINKIIKKLGDKINDPNEWLSYILSSKH